MSDKCDVCRDNRGLMTVTDADRAGYSPMRGGNRLAGWVTVVCSRCQVGRTVAKLRERNEARAAQHH